MTNAPLSEAERKRILESKRATWVSKDAAAEYQYHAYEKDPITRVKNLTEIRLALEHAQGPRILDAGAGTCRFTLPLAQRGHAVLAVDYSAAMLAAGWRTGRKQGFTWPCAVGDVFRLPLPDSTFDTVVCMNVLLHFPQWRDILRELARVLRPGGRALFDIASGEQAAYIRARGGDLAAPESPREYIARVSRRELDEAANEIGLSVLYTAPYDFFNENELLKRLFGPHYAEVMDMARGGLATAGGVSLYDLLTRRFLARLSPCLCPSVFCVLRRGGPDGETPAYRRYDGRLRGDTRPAQCAHIVRACLGDGYEPAVAELKNVLRDEEAARLFAILEQILMPRAPLEMLYWDEARP